MTKVIGVRFREVERYIIFHLATLNFVQERWLLWKPQGGLNVELWLEMGNREVG